MGDLLGPNVIHMMVTNIHVANKNFVHVCIVEEIECYTPNERDFLLSIS